MHLRFLAVLLVLSSGVVACGGGQPAPAPATEPGAAPAPAVDPASAATVAGKIGLEGTPPPNAPIRMNADRRASRPTRPESDAGPRQRRCGLGKCHYCQRGRTARFRPTQATVRSTGMPVSPTSSRAGRTAIEVLNTTDAAQYHAPENDFGVNTAKTIQGMKRRDFTPKKGLRLPCSATCGWMKPCGVVGTVLPVEQDGSFSIPNLRPAATRLRMHEKL